MVDRVQRVQGSVYDIGPKAQPGGAIYQATVASAISLASIDAKIASIDTNAMRMAQDATVIIGNDATNPVQVRGGVDADLRFIGSRPFKLGSAVMAAAMPVTLASDQPAIAVVTPALQSIAAADGALATLGATSDPASFGMVTATLSARLAALNANLEKVADAQAVAVELMQLQLQALNVIAGQLGGTPTFTYQ